MSELHIQRSVAGIRGLCVIDPAVFMDNREYLFETYNENKFINEGLDMHFVQDNQVYSRKGVLRGMHVNVMHPQGKLIRVCKGRIFDVVVDLRKESKTYKKWYGVELSDENKKQLYIPERMGHGYLALTDAEVLFKVTTHYIPNDEIGFSWRSKELSIAWPINEIEVIQNEADKSSRDLSKMGF